MGTWALIAANCRRGWKNSTRTYEGYATKSLNSIFNQPTNTMKKEKLFQSLFVDFVKQQGFLNIDKEIAKGNELAKLHEDKSDL